MSAGNYRGRSGNFFKHSLACWMLAKDKTYTFMIEKREKKFAWMRFKEAVRHHAWMNRTFIGRLKHMREARAERLSDKLKIHGKIPVEEFVKAADHLEAAYGQKQKDYVLVSHRRAVELARQQPEFVQVEHYRNEVKEVYKGEVGRLPIGGRLFRIIEAKNIEPDKSYVMKEDIFMHPWREAKIE